MKTIKNGTLEYEAAGNIRTPHCFTTRLGGVSTGIFESLDLAYREGGSMAAVEENIRILGRALGFDPERLVLTRQTHSDIVRVVRHTDHTSLCHRDYPECDALVTDDPGTALMVFTADCTPVLLWDRVTGAVGAAHAGWRGTAAKIAVKTLQAMVTDLGCDPKNIRAAIGPNIGQCCFQTDADVPQAMLASYGDAVKAFIRPEGDKFYVNLKEINALSLKNAGVEHIEISESCTVCESHRFWSHRVTRGLRGSQGAIIVCKGGRV